MIDNDSFNRLILLAGLSAREVTVLRAYARYLRQTGIAYSQDYIADDAGQISGDRRRHLPALPSTRIDPTLDGQAADEAHAELHRRRSKQALADVPSLDDDRILRRYVNVVDATLRTNYFQRDADGNRRRRCWPSSSIRSCSTACRSRGRSAKSSSTAPRSKACTCASARWRAAACAGRTAPQDYRTEVLGLVKAQQVKNAVIVPVGAKGGFYPEAAAGRRQPRRDLQGRHARPTRPISARCFRSPTTSSAQDVVPPADTLRLDGDDPYFVVAADKGTATFSDTANGLAQEAGFWLDDAFASGGSAGYDHKKMGITARGAWETVEAAFPRNGHRHPDDAVHRRRCRRHVRRRLRQRHAAVARRSG